MYFFYFSKIFEFISPAQRHKFTHLSNHKPSNLMNHILSGGFIQLLKLGPIFASSYSNRVTHNFIFNIVSIFHLEMRRIHADDAITACWTTEGRGGRPTYADHPSNVPYPGELENFGTFPPESKGTSECEYLIPILVYSQSKLYIFDPSMFYWWEDPTGVITPLFPVRVWLFGCYGYVLN